LPAAKVDEKRGINQPQTAGSEEVNGKRRRRRKKIGGGPGGREAVTRGEAEAEAAKQQPVRADDKRQW